MQRMGRGWAEDGQRRAEACRGVQRCTAGVSREPSPHLGAPPQLRGAGASCRDCGVGAAKVEVQRANVAPLRPCARRAGFERLERRAQAVDAPAVTRGGAVDKELHAGEGRRVVRVDEVARSRLAAREV